MPGNTRSRRKAIFSSMMDRDTLKIWRLSILPDLIKGGMITDAVWTDLNKDTWPDLVTVGEFMPVRVFINDLGKKFREATNSWFSIPETGLWKQIALADFDEDGNMDLIAGNFGTNSQLKARASNEPVELTFKDFDNNGSVDPVLTYYVLHKSYPFPSRNEMLEPINSAPGLSFPAFRILLGCPPCRPFFTGKFKNSFCFISQ